MDIKAEQLAQHLSKQFLPIYVVMGQEPLLVLETLDALRQHARKSGVGERRVLQADAQFSWSSLIEANQAMSLFSDRLLLELNLERKPDKAGQDVLQEYAASPNPDNILLVNGTALDRATLKTKWFKTFTAQAGVINVWPIQRQQLPQWLSQRARQLKLTLTPDAAQLLAERVDGNLLAAKQELEKLALLCDGEVTAELVLDSVVDNARFTVFDLTDAAHTGDLARAQRILDSLRSEGVEPLMVQWALTREARHAVQIQEKVRRGESIDQACMALRIMGPRQGPVKQAVNRIKPARWSTLLQLLQRTDAAVKGSDNLDPWLLMGQVVLRWAGR
ncbi:MAG: DNA polymerase III subunit delta [Natronospirillum sp.]